MLSKKIKKGLEGEGPMLASNFGRGSKLCLDSMLFGKSVQSFIHDAAKHIGAYIHQIDSSLFVWITQITFFWYKESYTHMPFPVVVFSFPEINYVFVYLFEIITVKAFEVICQYFCDVCCFVTFDFFNCSCKLLLRYVSVKLSKWLLFFDEFCCKGVSWSIIVVYFGEMISSFLYLMLACRYSFQFSLLQFLFRCIYLPQ